MNTDEVILLKATAQPGAVKLTWSVSSTAYLQSFLIVVTQDDVVKNRVSVPPAAREATVTCEGSGFVFNVEAIVAQGGKIASCDPLPVEPSSTLVAAVDTGGWGGELHRELTAGGIIGRRISNYPALIPQIEEAGGIVEVCILGKPGESPAAIRGQFKAVAAAFPNVKRLELMNEPSINGETAAGYAANVKAAREGIEESGNKTVLLLAEYGIERPLAAWVQTPSLALVDEIVQHAYGPNGPKHVEQAHAATGKPIAVTEFGAPTDVGGPALSDQPQLTEAEQCTFMEERYATWKALPFVTVAVWFNAVDYSGGNAWGVKHENLADKPSFATLGAICKSLV